jgi:hypothetical protein
MSDRTLPIRFALFGLAPFVVFAGQSWSQAAVFGALVGLLGLGLEKHLGAWFDGQIAFFGTLALLSSAPLTGPMGAPEPVSILLFLASSVVFVRLSRLPAPGPARLALAAILAAGPSARDLFGASWWRFGPENLGVALLGSSGLLYGAPLLWAGLLGLPALRREQPGLARLTAAALLPGLLGLLLITDQDRAWTRVLTWLPFLLPGLAQFFHRARAFATHHPERVVASAGALLVLWNILFMEQYRRLGVPSDDTVSFARVTSQSASLLSRFVGTPVAWPANWLFSRRFNTGLDRWDGLAGRSLFANATAATATIEFGDDPSPFAIDDTLLLEGFGAGHPCERGRCRDLYGAGRVLLPIGNAGDTEFMLRLRARGKGILQMSLNDSSIAVFEMPGSLADLVLRAPAKIVASRINILALSVEGGGKATLDRLTLERDLGNGSAR